MSRLNPWSKILVLWTSRVGIALLAALIALEMFIRWGVYDTIYRDNECVEYLSREASPSLPHRVFRANCRTSVSGLDGNSFAIETNEDGLRERPRGEFQQGALALLGDSHVEGFAFNIESSVGRRLEKHGIGAGGLKTLNFGFRGTGPSEQLRLFLRARAHYQIRGLLWILTENDVLDEFFYHRQGDGGTLKKLSSSLRRLSEEWFGRHFLTLEWLRIVAYSKAMDAAMKKHYHGPRIAAEMCETLVSVKGLLPKGTPITLVGIPHGLPAESLPYFGNRFERPPFWQALDCAAKKGIRVLDQRSFFEHVRASDSGPVSPRYRRN